MKDIKILTESKNRSFFFDTIKNIPFFEFTKLSFFRAGMPIPYIDESSPFNKINFRFRDDNDYLCRCEKEGVLPFSSLEVRFYNGKFSLDQLKISYTNNHYLNQEIALRYINGGAPHHLYLTFSNEYPRHPKILELWDSLKEQSEKFGYLLNNGFVHIHGPYTCGGIEENTNVKLTKKGNLTEFRYHQGKGLNHEQIADLSRWINSKQNLFFSKKIS